MRAAAAHGGRRIDQRPQRRDYPHGRAQLVRRGKFRRSAPSDLWADRQAGPIETPVTASQQTVDHFTLHM